MVNVTHKSEKEVKIVVEVSDKARSVVQEIWIGDVKVVLEIKDKR